MYLVKEALVEKLPSDGDLKIIAQKEQANKIKERKKEPPKENKTERKVERTGKGKQIL